MFKPMLAVAADVNKLRFPLLASPKLDGIRCSVVNGKALTRTLKAVPNKALSALLSRPELNGLDGELIVGEPTDPLVYANSVSVVMSHDKPIDKVSFHVFDFHNTDEGFANRLSEVNRLTRQVGTPLVLVPHTIVSSPNELSIYEEAAVNAGYEGVILRGMYDRYKFGRSTVNEGFMLKLKRFEDSEAEIIGFEEEMHNGNVAETNELGRTKRSTCAGGLVGKSTLGAFLVRDVFSGVEFSVGTGLTAYEREQAWASRAELLGSLLKYKFFPVGVKDKPRHPVFLGFRSKLDL